MQHNCVPNKDKHIITTMHIFNLIGLQDSHSCGELGRIKFVAIMKLGKHERAPCICVKGHIVCPTQPRREIRRHQHKSLKQHEETIHSSNKSHSNDKVGNHMRDKLCQGFGTDKAQKHCQVVPQGRLHASESNDNGCHQECQQRCAWDAGNTLGHLVEDGMIVSVAHFLVNNTTFNDGEGQNGDGHENKEGHTIKQHSRPRLDRFKVDTISQIKKQCPHHERQHAVHGHTGK
mmetsp:Transcript_12761/g.29686  ORF Transcript_12761/g.29686 Transcript_12761/m.29686 type:complete len:232 (-) Transcript_12761:112-807(-)